MERLTVTSTGWNPNYFPQNVAADLGFFADEGLEVVRRPQDPWENVLTDLASGEADVALGGMWVPAMYHGVGHDLVVVGQLNGCYAQALVSRRGAAEFDWSDLAGRTVLVPGKGSTAGYTFLTGLMHEVGAAPADTRFVRDLSTPMMTELYTGGFGDFLLVDLVTAFALERDGQAVIAVRLAETGGLLPNSTYYMRRDRVDAMLPRLTAFLAGVQRGMAWATNAGASEVEQRVDATFAHLRLDAVRAAVAHVRGTQTWESVALDRGAFDRWIGFQAKVPLIGAPIEWADLVDDRAMRSISYT